MDTRNLWRPPSRRQRSYHQIRSKPPVPLCSSQRLHPICVLGTTWRASNKRRGVWHLPFQKQIVLIYADALWVERGVGSHGAIRERLAYQDGKAHCAPWVVYATQNESWKALRNRTDTQDSGHRHPFLPLNVFWLLDVRGRYQEIERAKRTVQVHPGGIRKND